MIVVDDNFVELFEGVYRRRARDIQYFGEIWSSKKVIGATGVESRASLTAFPFLANVDARRRPNNHKILAVVG